MKKPIDWVYNYFLKKNKFSICDYYKRINLDIFDEGFIDSLGVIDLITQIESTFNLELKAEDMQDIRFRTISGMAEIIEQRKKTEG